MGDGGARRPSSRLVFVFLFAEPLERRGRQSPPGTPLSQSTDSVPPTPQTALPSTRQLAAMLHGFLHRLQSSGQQPVQAQLLWALQQAARDERADTDLGFQVHQFVRRLWSRTAPQMAWLVLRARQRVAGDANDGA